MLKIEKRNLFLLLLIIGTAFWGISFPVTKMAIGGKASALFLFYRFLLATVVLSIVFYKELKKIDKGALLAGMGLALPLSFGINFQTLGVRYTSASQCAFVAGTCVVIIPLLKLIFYRKSVGLKIWMAAIVALVGLFVISMGSNFVVNIGDVYTFIGALGFAVYLLMVERVSSSRNILSTIVPMFATCTLFAFCAVLIEGTGEWRPTGSVFWYGILYCSLFSTAYMYSVSNVSQRFISAERIAIIYLFEPVFAALAAFLLLGENLSLRLVLGGGLIFLGTLIAEINWKLPKRKTAIC